LYTIIVIMTLLIGYFLYGMGYLIVVSPDTVDTFKTHLDKVWSDQKVLYCMIITQISMSLETVVFTS